MIKSCSKCEKPRLVGKACVFCKAQRNTEWRRNNKEKNRVHQRTYYLRKERDNWARELFRSAKYRAKKKGIEFAILETDIIVPTHCPILGIALERGVGKGGKRENSPSLDRIDNNKGYLVDNIVVISAKANTIKSNAISEELFQVAEWLKQQEMRRG